MDRKLLAIIFGVCLSLINFSALAWNQGISIGYGIGQDTNHHNDTTSGFILTGNLFTVAQSNWWHFTVDGSLGRWFNTSETNKNLFTSALTLGLRVYTPYIYSLHPYFLANAGPSYISSRQFGLNRQGSNFAFQSILGIGVEKLNACHQGFDANVKLVHYSNAYLFPPNEGYNILPVVSLGYLF